MRLTAFRLGVLVVSFGVAGGVVASAQSLPPTVPRGPQADQLRTQISVMEGMLERAVGEGIRETMAQIPDALSVPWMLSPNSRAHGFKIDGYGVFFSVEVPGLSPSITWSLQVMSRNSDEAILKDLDEMRNLVVKLSDQKMRAEMQQRIDQVESRISGVPPGGGTSGTGMRRVRTLAPERPTKQPDEIYTEAVRSALVKAILDQGGAFEIAPEESLTVAARGSEGPRVSAFPDQETATMYLTIKGKDLAALRRGQMSREQAAKSVSVTHF